MASSEEIQLQAGLYKTIMRTGNGTQLQINDKVTVHCTGFINSDPPTKFWSTKDPGQQPFTFNVGIGQVIQGWDYGCLSMTIGEEASLRIAPELGYGKDGFPAWNIPPNAELLFEIKVLSVEGK